MAVEEYKFSSYSTICLLYYIRLTEFYCRNNVNVSTMYSNFMALKFSKIPLLTLFLLSILPILFMSGNTKFWCLVNIIVFTFFFIWTYSVTKKLIEKNKYDTEIKFDHFTLQIVLTNIYIIALLIYFGLAYPNMALMLTMNF